MGNQLRLVKPAIDLEKEYFSFYQEWINSGEKMVPWVIQKDLTNTLLPQKQF